MAAALLRISPAGVPSTSTTVQTSPVILPGGDFRLTYHSNGNGSLINPVLLILGIPGSVSTAPALSFSGASSGFGGVTTTVGGTNVYGGSWNTGTGAAGTFNSSSPDVYAFLNLNAQNVPNSAQYVNLNGATGLTSWSVFVYSVAFTNPNMAAGTWAQFTAALPNGSFVVGYGCDSGFNTNQGPCSNGGNTQGTPFTWTGVVQQVPEPASLSLLIPGAAFFFIRRRKRS